MHLNYLLYRLLTFVLSPILFAFIIWLAIKNKDAACFWQRLGFHLSHLPKNAIWFHCASVGEVNTLLPLLNKLHTKNNQYQFIITTNTPTGKKTIDNQNLNYVFHSYLPFDWKFSIKNFISTTDPKKLYVMETEIWPTLYHQLQQHKVAIFIINARLSSKSTTANRWIKSLLNFSLSKVQGIYARSKEDAAEFIALGAKASIIEHTGNLKFTTVLNRHTENSVVIDREYILLASTHKNEEVEIYNIWKNLHREELLIIAPRHPERVASIVKNINCDHISLSSKQQPISDKTEIFILDTIGELKNYFKNSKLVIMGGSFAPIGGHNILEPGSYNAAVITGPHMSNFKNEVKLMLDENALLQVNDYTGLEKTLRELLDDEGKREKLKINTKNLAFNANTILKNYTDLILNEDNNI